MPLVLIVIDNRFFKVRFFFGTPFNAVALILVAGDLGQDTSGLLATHHRDARIGPHKHKSWVIGATTHAVVARSK